MRGPRQQPGAAEIVEGGEHKVQSDWRFRELEKVSERFHKCLASWKDAKETAWWRCLFD